jgi:serine/threonine protein phosphatase 1
MGERVLVIGDIHGCLVQLEALLGAVGLTEGDHVVLLGDYVDRGPDSAGVLKRIIALSKIHRVTAIKGNHEEMMLAARGGLEYLRMWVINGGDATLESYVGRRATIRDVPREHWQFLETGLVDYLETDTHIFVHANAYPDQAMDKQPNYMLRWERCDEIRPHESGKMIVCGHTPQWDGMPMNRGFAICIDTGAGYGGPLTCLDVLSGSMWQADSQGKVSRSQIADYGDR